MELLSVLLFLGVFPCCNLQSLLCLISFGPTVSARTLNREVFWLSYLHTLCNLLFSRRLSVPAAQSKPGYFPGDPCTNAVNRCCLGSCTRPVMSDTAKRILFYLTPTSLKHWCHKFTVPVIGILQHSKTGFYVCVHPNDMRVG